MEQFLNNLKQALDSKLPGEAAQYAMAPVGRKQEEQQGFKNIPYRNSAVMIVFCKDKQGELFFPLIERMDYKGIHSGQIALPGGKYDEQDKNLENTAIRECYEEIGLKELNLVGKLSPLLIPVSGFRVQPFISYYEMPEPKLFANQREVKNILRMSINRLMDETTVKQGSVTVNKSFKLETPYFDLNGTQVWGATAMILSELKALIRTKTL